MRHPALAVVILAACLAGCSPSSSPSICEPAEQSVARVWDEVALDAIRLDFPAPTVHARNLFHLSVAMWDTWAFFDDGADPVMVSSSEPILDRAVDEALRAEAEGTRKVAVSFAAHEVLSDRYRQAIGSERSLARFDELLAELCLDPSMADEPQSAAALGRAIGRNVLDQSADDGSREAERYVAPFEVANEPLVLEEPGTSMNDPNRWQQLTFVVAQTQNGLLLESTTQDYIGPHWGSVRPFALELSDDGLPIDPGPPPLLGSETEAEFRAAAVEVVRASSELDPATGPKVDIGPGSQGGNALGANDGDGHALNPVTGSPYEQNLVPAADFKRVIAEFWADGPDSETPPGHWNSLANEASDLIEEHRIGGEGPVIDRLEWDLSLYLALNGALHDSAIAAWGAKNVYDYARPISMIRHLGGRGELPLEDGLVEIVTEQSSLAGERHEHLADRVGEVAILAWAPKPVYFGEELNPVRWIPAVDWLPYQRPTFVTPAFPGYVSGHSTFSRAAAEVLTAMTGDEYFPGGLAVHDVPVGALEFEHGPSVAVQLQWATYYDAADEAGLSRIYGGIHVEADDVAGRVMGSEVGKTAWRKARSYFRS